MREVTVKVYQFSELSDKAKDRAMYDDKSVTGYPFATESIASIKKLVEHFGGKMQDYSIDFFDCSHSHAMFDMPELELRDLKARLKDLGEYDPVTLNGGGDCKLTGYCADESAIEGFRKAFFAGERDLEKLMQASFDSWLKPAQADCEEYYSYDAYAEHADANGYKYMANGQFFVG